MIQIQLTSKSLAIVKRSSAHLAAIDLMPFPISTVTRSSRPFATIAVPMFPTTIDDAQAGFMGVDSFLEGAGGTILQGADA